MALKIVPSKSLKHKTSSAKGRSVRSLEPVPARSIWSRSALGFPSPGLTQNVRADVCVVGAGIAGLTTAYLLAREGKSVVVVEKGALGECETSRTSGHLSNVMDGGYRRIESLHGEKGARLAAQSHATAITRIDFTVAREHIDCDFERVDGYLFLGPKTSKKYLQEEFEAAQRASVKVNKLERPPFDLNLGPCLRFRRQAQFHPLKYLDGLAAAIKRYGGRIYCGTEAKDIKGGRTAEIRTKNGRKISAGAVVLATSNPMNGWAASRTKKCTFRRYVVGIPIPTDSIPKALYWDMEDPFHYARVLRMKGGRAERDVLIVGGEDHKAKLAEASEKRFARLRAWARTHFAATEEPQFQWSGQVMDTVDGLASIGGNPGDEDNVYIATGNSGIGLTYGTIAGLLLTDLILNRHNEWTSLYDPSRKSLHTPTEFVVHHHNANPQFRSWVMPNEVSSAEAIKPGTAAIIRKGVSKVAVYRDHDGKLNSAACPHVGCVLSWNAKERVWFCPCHGSLSQLDSNRSLEGLGSQGDAMSTVFLICGLPGAGKTTLAKQLERQRAALRLTPDEWIPSLFGDDIEQSKLDACRPPVEALQWDIAARVLASGVDVILDWGFWRRREREEYRARAKALGARAELRFLDVSRRDLWTRLAGRNANLPPGAFHVDEAHFDMWSNSFEPPTSDELE